MNIQQASDKRLLEQVFRIVQNSATGTLTITASTIAKGAAVVLETNTGSLPSTTTDSSVSQNFVMRAVTVTSLVNNLVVGILAQVPGTKAYLDREEVGLALCHGVYPNAIVQRPTAGFVVGNVLVPDGIQALIAVGGPVTGITTAANVEVPAIGGLFYALSALGTSGATETTTIPVLVRAM